MFELLICVLILTIKTDVVYGKYIAVSQGTLIHHKTLATWDEAYEQCQLEGAILASPITTELFNKMQSVIGANNNKYFTGTSSRFNKNVFVSIEGVPLHKMPVPDLYEIIDSEQNRCLAMDSYSISAVSCSSRLPYICYTKEDLTRTACGTFDKGYKYLSATGSCYKLHSNFTNWVNAFAKCIAEDAYLAIINDKNEAKVLASDILIDKTQYVWIGLEDWKATDEWKSVHGQPLSELHHEWDSSNKKSNKTTRCAAVNPNMGDLHDNGDCINGFTQPFLCEKDMTEIGAVIERFQFSSEKIRT